MNDNNMTSWWRVTAQRGENTPVAEAFNGPVYHQARAAFDRLDAAGEHYDLQLITCTETIHLTGGTKNRRKAGRL